MINIAFLTLLEACVLIALSGPVKWVAWLSAWVSGLLMPLLFKGLWLIAGGIMDELYVAAEPVESNHAQLLWLPGITVLLIVALHLTKSAESLWLPGVVALSAIPLMVQPFFQAAGISVLCFLLFLDQLYRVGNDGNGVGYGVGTMFYMMILLGGGMWKGLYLLVAG